MHNQDAADMREGTHQQPHALGPYSEWEDDPSSEWRRLTRALLLIEHLLDTTPHLM